MPQHHLTAKDGSQIAYKTIGEGPALVFTNGFASSDFYWRHLIERFRQRTKIVTWDLKGHGNSSAAVDLKATSVLDSVDDLRRVLDANNIKKASLVSFSLGCQIILEAWRQMPERICALVPILGTYEYPFNHLLHPKLGPQLHKLFTRFAPRTASSVLKLAYYNTRLPGSLRLNQLLGIVGRRVQQQDMDLFYEHMKQIDGPTWAAMGIAAQQHSAKDILPTITVPTLIVAGGRDTFTPLHLSEHMAKTIDHAEYLYLPECCHTGLFEYPEEIGQAMQSFLERNNILQATDS